ncbi:MAG: hypothetical protein VB018_12195 [Lachnospiraceae bacterium]|nr:hypothetical protein [Lachnospiraceae bacterium]
MISPEEAIDIIRKYLELVQVITVAGIVYIVASGEMTAINATNSFCA